MNPSLKIAIFHCGFTYSGGGERLVLEEVKGLRELGHDVVCYAPTLDQWACFPDFIEEIGVNTFLPQLPKWVPMRDAFAMVLSSLLAPLLAIGFTQVDVFIGANQPGAWIAFCMSKVLGKPYVVYMNQPNRLIYPRQIDRNTGWMNKPDYRVLDWIIRKLKRFVAWADHVSFTGADSMLANGGYIGKVIESVYGREVVLCPAGCNPQPKELLRLSRDLPTKKELRLGEHVIEKPYALITNRHEPQKKFEFVIEAFSQIADLVQNARVMIPGPFTPHTEKLMALTAQLGIEHRVLFLGQISETDLQRLYREAAVYCYPAPEEDFGMGVIEAMAWGVPVVAWNHGGPTVTVVHGHTGYLAERNQVRAYAEAMQVLLTDASLRNQMGAAAHDRAVRYYSWGRHVQILERAVRRAIGEDVELRVPIAIPRPVYRGAGLLRLPSEPVQELAEVDTQPFVRQD